MQPRDIAFILIPKFSMIALYSALEPLRVVNRFKPNTFSWRFVSQDGEAVVASNGIPVSVTVRLGEIGRADMAAVCASYEYEQHGQRGTLNVLRHLARSGTLLAGIDTGAFLLAEAGVLDGYRATCHWETLPAFKECYPRIDVRDTLYVIDRGRFSSSGGASALDMMLEWIGALEGDAMERTVADTLVHSRHANLPGEARIPAGNRYGIDDDRLANVIEAMESHTEDVLHIGDLAGVSGVSVRQLERLFHTALGTTPVAFYLRLRLERASQLLCYSTISVRDTGLACGFSSLAQFSRQFKACYGAAPSHFRRVG